MHADNDMYTIKKAQTVHAKKTGENAPGMCGAMHQDNLKWPTHAETQPSVLGAQQSNVQLRF